MPLTSGTKLGPYEIQSLLGTGGMGEVYRARDTRLERVVAIKVLPSDLASSFELKQRFEREARAISSLQHPNICTLHDIGSQNGVDFLVMEYLEGRTLADRLAEGALPIDEALKVGAEIADALDKAHRQGIIHRDLKPGNIMLTKSGAKLMDFGLAKPAVVLAAGAGATRTATPATPTMSVASLTAAVSPVTQKGTIVGTFQYMAPETLRGAEADARSDIFSFGCVLYEMLTGRRAFEGKSQLSVLTAILEKEPEPIAAIQPLAPRALHHLVCACLAKDLDRRTACAHDLKLELEWLASESEPPVKANEAQRPWQKRALWLAVVLLCVAGFAYLLVRRPAQRVIRSSLLPPKNSVLDAPSSPGSFAVAPDGSAVVFSAVADGVERLYLRRLNEPEASVLTGTEDGRYPFWSPDSNSIGFFTNGEVRRLDLRGGPPVNLCQASNGRGGAWAQDGNIYFVPSTGTDLMRVPASGGTPATVIRVDRPRHDTYRWPVLLPDDKHLIFFAGDHSDTTNDRAEIIWAAIDGREKHVLLRSTSNAAYAAGYLLFTRDGTLMAQKLDASSGTLSGDPHLVVEGVQLDPSTWRASFSVDPNGALLTYIGGATANMTHLVALDDSAKTTGEITAPEMPVSVRFSWTGNKLLTVAGQPRSSIWITDLERHVAAPFTFEQDHQSAVWSPDGRYIAYCERGGTGRYFSIWEKTANGTEPARHLLDSGEDDCPADWSPDGKTLAFVRSRNSQQIWLLPLAGGKPYPLFDNAEPDTVYVNPMFSPDGRWLAYVEGHQGKNIVEVVSFPSRSGRWQISTANSALLPFWNRNGKELFYVGDNNQLLSTKVDGAGSEFQVGATRAIARLPLAYPTGSMQTIDAFPSGKGFAAVLRVGDSSASLSLVQNFTNELKK